ncbi:hypothetical protein AB4156_44030, partial [Cupriavidus sp. 2MCAB6]|uniref:hypothetical protein n=1 Tax=Cupriavidus sp. 2MCAB6 TaxID=3232981 RepID=UPI003F90A62F
MADRSFSCNPQLRIERTLPAANAQLGIGEELVGHLLEFRRRQETRGRPIVLVHGLADLDGEAELLRDAFGRLDRLALGRRDDEPGSDEPRRSRKGLG